MIDYQQYFAWPDVQIMYYYGYFIVALLIAGYLVLLGGTRYKLELFFLSFYLLTGNLNKLLTIKLPGVSLFEIQPIRFIFLLLCFFILRKTILSRTSFRVSSSFKIPWFMVALVCYVTLLITSVFYNSPDMELRVVLDQIHDALAFLVLILAIGLMADKPSYDIIGKSIIIGAIVSSLVSLIQLGVDPYFLRIGDARPAFGSFLRSNGIFSTEYFNSYYLIIAATWTLNTVKHNTLKFVLVTLFTLGVISSFQRMSWIILAIVLVVYLVYVQRLAFEKLALIGLSGLAVLLTVTLLYFQDIQNSSLVRERLSDTVGGRIGYYTLVLENIDKKPLFGYGDLKNEVYYNNILKITGSRSRATAQSGDLHSGYFSSMFLYGIPAFLCFTAFVILSVVYYSRSYGKNAYFVIPFLVSIIFMIGNLTNTFLFLKYISILFAIHIGIGMGLNRIKAQAQR